MDIVVRNAPEELVRKIKHAAVDSGIGIKHWVLDACEAKLAKEPKECVEPNKSTGKPSKKESAPATHLIEGTYQCPICESKCKKWGMGWRCETCNRNF